MASTWILGCQLILRSRVGARLSSSHARWTRGPEHSAGTQANYVFKLARARPFPNPTAAAWAIFWYINIGFPVLTKRQEELLRRAGRRRACEHEREGLWEVESAHRKAFFEKMADIFVPRKNADADTNEGQKSVSYPWGLLNVFESTLSDKDTRPGANIPAPDVVMSQ